VLLLNECFYCYLFRYRLSHETFGYALIRSQKSRDCSVGIALGYGLEDRGFRVRFPTEAGNFSLHHRVQNGSGSTQPPTQWVPGALSQGVKRLGREADHSPLSSAEVKKMRGAIPPLPQYAFMVWCLVKHRDNFSFT
jgi:hypothetical protein